MNASATTADTIETVEAGRARLDDIDAQIIHLLGERRVVSRHVQQLRMNGGGSRIEHSRENAIIRRWADALGDGGVELAMAMLAHCRGRS